MSVFDVREDVEVKIDEIRFASDQDIASGVIQAYRLRKFDSSCLMIEDKEHNDSDSDQGFVLVTSKYHAENLIKALNKAVELGWLK